MYKKILVPVDGSSTADRGLAEAIALAKVMGARLKLLHVIDRPTAVSAEASAYSSQLEEELKDAGARVLAQAEQKVRSAGLDVDTALVDSPQGRLCDLVAAQVDEGGAELVVLGTHGRRGVRRLVLGSDAEAIVRTTKVPVLLVRAQ